MADTEKLKQELTSLVQAIMAEAWDEGWNDGAGWPQNDINPYRVKP